MSELLAGLGVTLDPVWLLIGAVFVVGIWAVVALPNMVKKIVGLSVANSAVIMLFIYFGSLSGDTAPILTGTEGTPVDPLPQALMLTAIVIGVCVIALALGLVHQLYRRHGTVDMRRIEETVWKDHA
jgi:multicomponent Na+:H+ antiporter subunit C